MKGKKAMSINESMIRDLDITNMNAEAALGSLQYAESFFPEEPIEEAQLPPSVVTSDNDGLINVMLLHPKVEPELQTLLNDQKQNLIDLTGLGTAFVAKQAEKDSQKKYDIELWQRDISSI